MIEMVNALWRPITGFVMAAVVLAIALGLLPPSAEAHANSLLTAAGAVLVGLTGMRGVQRVAEVQADAAKAQIDAKIASAIPATVAAARVVAEPPPQVVELLDQVKGLREQLGALHR